MYCHYNMCHNSIHSGKASLFHCHLILLFFYNLQHMQEEMNSTITFLECATDFMGSILQTLTSDAVQYTPSNTTITTRQAVYQAYKNVTWISDLKKLTKVFPCAKPSSPQSVSTCTTTYDSIEISQVSN